MLLFGRDSCKGEEKEASQPVLGTGEARGLSCEQQHECYSSGATLARAREHRLLSLFSILARRESFLAQTQIFPAQGSVDVTLSGGSVARGEGREAPQPVLNPGEERTLFSRMARGEHLLL
jgi:hypothetical protein